MDNCSILGCKRRSEQQNPEISYHSFPLDPRIINQWISSTGRQNWQPTKISKVCSLHFGNDLIVFMNKKKWLLPHSVPTKYIHGPVEESSSQRKRPSQDLGEVLPKRARMAPLAMKAVENILCIEEAPFAKSPSGSSKTPFEDMENVLPTEECSLENDVENWMKYKMFGGKLFLKRDVVPHIFECQNRMMPMKPRSAITKRKRHEILESIENTPDPSLEDFEEIKETHDLNVKIYNDKSLQVAIYPHKRSKQVQVEMRTPQKTVALSPKRVDVRNCTTSPIKLNAYRLIYSSDSDSVKSLFEHEEETGSTSESVLSECKILKHQQLCDITMSRIMAQPKLYIGIPLSSIILVELLQKQLKCQLHHICLVFKKLRLNESFSILAEDFDLHETTASRIFSKTCGKMAAILKKFIIQPSREQVLANLPISFRNSYSKTYCIIDCLEIEIEVPSDAVHQSLTYSSYKKCNTLKYLISSTPDGVINFVSDGFGGRISDLKIFEESGFIDIIPPGAFIMADRGFKHIEAVLAKKQIQLIRPPSVSYTKKSSKEDVLRSKKIASLRIHIERVIRRLREFAYLKPHACIDHFLIPNVDSAMIICSALVNLQSPLIKIG